MAKYQRLVADAVFPDPLSSRRVALRDANSAIAEYRRSTGDVAGTVDLMLTFIEAGTEQAADPRHDAANERGGVHTNQLCTRNLWRAMGGRGALPTRDVLRPWAGTKLGAWSMREVPTRFGDLVVALEEGTYLTVLCPLIHQPALIPAFAATIQREWIRRAEIHWYEAHGIGKKEFKRKRHLE